MHKSFIVFRNIKPKKILFKQKGSCFDLVLNDFMLASKYRQLKPHENKFFQDKQINLTQIHKFSSINQHLGLSKASCLTISSLKPQGRLGVTGLLDFLLPEVREAVQAEAEIQKFESERARVDENQLYPGSGLSERAPGVLLVLSFCQVAQLDGFPDEGLRWLSETLSQDNQEYQELRESGENGDEHN